MFFYGFFVTLSLYCSIILLHLISYLLNPISLLVPCAYVSTELIDCIFFFLSSFEVKAIFSISSVKASCFQI